MTNDFMSILIDSKKNYELFIKEINVSSVGQSSWKKCLFYKTWKTLCVKVSDVTKFTLIGKSTRK